jgi:hypothetical protein
LEVKRKVSRISAARAQMVEESTLGSTQLVVSSETQSEEVERVGAVGLGSNVDGGVGVDVGWSSENDGGIRSVESLSTHLGPVGHLTNCEGVRSGVFYSRKCLVGFEPEG